MISKPSSNRETFSLSRYRRYYTYIEPLVADPVFRGYFEVVASIILVSFLIAFALSPTITTILGLVKKIDDQKQTLEQMKSKVNDLSQAHQIYSQYEDRFPLLLENLPNTPVPQTLITSILVAGSNANVKIDSLQFSDINLSDNNQAKGSVSDSDAGLVSPGPLKVQAILVDMGISGTEKNVRNYLTYLETSPRLIRLNSLSFAAASPGSPQTVSVRGVGLFYPETNPVK